MKLPKYLLLNKEVGETPLEVIQDYKRDNHAFAAVPMAYAGRLDPLASGQLLILVGDECKKLTSYTGLDKEYEFEVLLGFKTDSADLLGLGEIGVLPKAAPTKQEISKAASSLEGKQRFSYPAFSSKTVNGKPLFQYALEGTIDEIEIPTKDVMVFELKHLGTREVVANDLFEQISHKIESIKPVTEHQKALGNDFRRPEIRKRYSDISSQIDKDQKFFILRFRCVCSSGTYMRTLAQMIGQRLGTYGTAFSIHRTIIGQYVKLGPIGFWKKRYTL